MRSRLLGSVAALALTVGVVAASSVPASAQRWHGPGFWPAEVAAGIVGGAVAAATSPLWAPGYYDYYPGYAYQPYPYRRYGYDTYGYDNYANNGYYAPPAVTVAPGTVVAQNGDSIAYCQSRFRSYDATTGTYLGFDGQRHPCP